MRRSLTTGLACFLLLCGAARAEKIGTLVSEVGVHPILIEGTGVVTGLAGKGDKAKAAVKLLRNYMENLGLPLDEKDLATGNLALVRVEASLPPHATVGKFIAARVSAINGTTDLTNGNLLITDLKAGHGRDAQCFAKAKGKLIVNKGDLTNAMLPANEYGGAQVLLPNPMSPVDRDGMLVLALNRPGYADANAIARAVNNSDLNPFRRDTRGFDAARESPSIAWALEGGGKVQVRIPRNQRQREVDFIDNLYRLEVDLARPPQIVINHGTGFVMAVGDFKIETRGVVSVQGKTVTIGPPPPPGNPNDRVYTLEDGTPRSLVELGGYNTEIELNQLITTLNAMGLDSREIATVFQQLRDKGVIRAELYVE